MAQDKSKPTCDQVLEQCKKTVDAKNKELQVADLAIKQCSDSNAKLSSQVEKLTEDKNSLWRNPFFLGLLGVVAGFAISRTVLK